MTCAVSEFRSSGPVDVGPRDLCVAVFETCIIDCLPIFTAEDSGSLCWLFPDLSALRATSECCIAHVRLSQPSLNRLVLLSSVCNAAVDELVKAATAGRCA